MKRKGFLKMNQKGLLYFLFFIFTGNNATMFAQDYLDICTTNDAIFNTNITRTPQDSTAINN